VNQVLSEYNIGLSTIYDLKAQKNKLLSFAAVLKVAVKLQMNIKTFESLKQIL
jgi:hypothetical protein